MGYASTIPFILSHVVKTEGAGSDYISLHLLAENKTLDTIKTLNYHFPITNAYARLVCPVCQDNSGATNYLNPTAGGYIQLDDGTSTQNVGDITSYYCMVPANGITTEQYHPFWTNIAHYLKPDTSYTVIFVNAQAVADHLIIYRPRLDICMFGGI
jgi:hypothetical protein